MPTVGELFVKLGFNVDDRALAGFDNGIQSLSRNMLGVIGISSATAYGISRFVGNAVSGAQSLKSLSIQTGLAEEELQKYAAAAHAADNTLTFDQALQNIAAVQKKLNDIKMIGGDLTPFRGLDVSNFNAIDLLRQMQASFAGLPVEEVARRLDKMGFDPRMVGLVALTAEEIETLGGQADLTAEQLENLAAAGQAMDNLKTRLTTFLKGEVADIFPKIRKEMDYAAVTVERLGEKFNEFFQSFDPETRKDFEDAIGRIKEAFSGGPIDLMHNILGFINEIMDYSEGKNGTRFDGLTGLFTPGHPGNIVQRLSDLNDKYGGSPQANTTVHNSYTVNSTAPAKDLVDELNARQYHDVTQQRNNAGAY